MSWGSARARDARRQSAVKRLEANVAFYKRSIADVQAGKQLRLSAGDPLTKERALARQTAKLEDAEMALANTKANMGKGTCAMNKRVRKAKPSKMDGVTNKDLL